MTLDELAALLRSYGQQAYGNSDPAPTSGLLGDATAWLDAKKRAAWGRVTDAAANPQATLASLGADVTRMARGGIDAANAQRSVMPQVQEQGNAEMTNALLNSGGLLGITGYHGSPHLFDRFDINKAGTTTDAGQLGRALYFSTDPTIGAGKAYKYKVDADIKSPLELKLPNWEASKEELVRKALDLPKSATAEEVTKAAKKRGYDSVVLDYSPVGYKHKEIAVFDDSLISMEK